MRAARFHGRLDIRIDEIPKPIPKENEVLVDIEWCGICGSDLHEYQHGQRDLCHYTKITNITRRTHDRTQRRESSSDYQGGDSYNYRSRVLWSN